MIFFGARPATCRNAAGSASSIDPYYEEVLIARVHPEILRSEGIPDAPHDEKTTLARPVSVDH